MQKETCLTIDEDISVPSIEIEWLNLAVEQACPRANHVLNKLIVNQKFSPIQCLKFKYYLNWNYRHFFYLVRVTFRTVVKEKSLFSLNHRFLRVNNKNQLFWNLLCCYLYLSWEYLFWAWWENNCQIKYSDYLFKCPTPH